MKKLSFILIAPMTLSLTAYNAQNSPESIGKQLFNALKTLSHSNGDNLTVNFLKKDDGENLLREIKSKAVQRSVSLLKTVRLVLPNDTYRFKKAGTGKAGEDLIAYIFELGDTWEATPQNRLNYSEKCG